MGEYIHVHAHVGVWPGRVQSVNTWPTERGNSEGTN